MMIRISRITLLALILSPSFKLGRSQVIRNGNCVVDREILKLPDCALEERSGQQYVSQIYLPLFSFTEPHHLAWANVNGEGWVYFNRRGRIVVRNVAMFDNGPSPFHHGLVRIVSENKWGLAGSGGALFRCNTTECSNLQSMISAGRPALAAATLQKGNTADLKAATGFGWIDPVKT
jgi:hypothetical protein